jgi:hypothetical protein
MLARRMERSGRPRLIIVDQKRLGPRKPADQRGKGASGSMGPGGGVAGSRPLGRAGTLTEAAAAVVSEEAAVDGDGDAAGDAAGAVGSARAAVVVLSVESGVACGAGVAAPRAK